MSLLPPLPPLSLALVDLAVDVPAGNDLFRAQCGAARDAGYRAVQLNGAAPGVRARELDRSARRDLAAFLRRSELSISGADLWIPPEHFVDTTRVERAVSAVVTTIELVADLDRLLRGGTPAHPAPGPDGRLVCLTLPESVPEATLAPLRAKAVDCGAQVADFGPYAAKLAGAPSEIGAGFDPAAYLLANPSAVPRNEMGALPLPPNLVSARLSDANAFGRLAPGTAGGRLDLLSYGATLAARGYGRHVVADMRGLSAQLPAARQARETWEGSTSRI